VGCEGRPRHQPRVLSRAFALFLGLTAIKLFLSLAH
jgi:hypothetical protein